MTATTQKKTDRAATKDSPALRHSSGRGEAAEPEIISRIRIKIRAYDNKIIDQATKNIIETAERHGATIVGPIPLPTEKTKFTVNRSTFVHKDAREQFEMRVHKRLIDIINPTAKTVDALMSLQVPAGVDIEIKM